MESAPFEFLSTLLGTPSPSGFEERIQAEVRTYIAEYADEVCVDIHGNLIASINPTAPLRVMLAGHCDQIGMIVTHIDSEGFLYAQTIGGWDPQQLIGQRMSIWTKQGVVPALISKKPIHLLTDDERKQNVKLEDLWLDIGASSEQDARSAVEVGDFVTLDLGIKRMRNNLANAPGMDNRTGLWVVMEALRRVSSRSPQCGVFAVSTVQEEIGLRGAKTSAFGIDPHVAIAVDVTHATDCPTIDKRRQGDLSLGQGPVIFRGPNMNPKVSQQLIDISKSQQIPAQVAAIGRATSNDANSLQINRAGVATGLVAIPNRYMHSAVETISLDDIDHAADLLAEFLVAISPDADFTP